MLAYIGRRALLAVFTVWAISALAFAIIQLPPGDYVTSYIAQMASMGRDRKITRLNSSHRALSRMPSSA